ncbi:glycosyltransferase [Geomobilimonas luticola]|uniref:Glycosyltransferase n=1 Tax=Geomobilimonas luticola TaxID=1114878 RepID=A0ABS5SC46_9BACT|nr:glycosyltransferase [Geomobilimonas luticola]MBT0652935.1 glycosyltransferase [Geomobilimonas luticola]
MRKVLVIADDFPGLGGRNLGLINGLSKFGYEPIVITNRKQNYTVYNDELKKPLTIYTTLCFHKTPFRLFSKVFNSWRLKEYFESIFFVPDLYINWVPFAVVRALFVIARVDIHAIITISPPESVHLTGMILKKITCIKWISDFEDLWTVKLVNYKPPTFMHDYVIKSLERIIYNSVDHIVANTEGNRNIYSRFYDVPDAKISVVGLGYDREEIYALDRKRKTSRNTVFTMGYMGFFDKTGFPWEQYLVVVKRLVDALNGDLCLKICGTVSKKALDFIRDNHLAPFVEFCGTLSHVKAMEVMAETDLLILLMYETEYSQAIIPHKLYYYLGLNKPIFAIAQHDGEVAQIVRRTKSGIVVSVSEEEVIYNTLLGFYTRFKSNEEGLVYSPIATEVEKYEISYSSHKLAAVIDLLTQSAERNGYVT